MTRKVTVLLICMLGSFIYGFSQDDSGNLKITAKPNDMWEVGIHLGHNILTGDVDWDSDFGIGLHLRKALDYSFSIRLDAGYYRMSGTEQEDTRRIDGNFYGFTNWKPEYSSTSIAGDISVVFSLNQIKVGKKNKINPYVFAGAGAASLTATAINGTEERDVWESRNFDDDWNISPYITGGMGLGFRLTNKISLSLEHKLMSYLGRVDDLLDASEWRGTPGGDESITSTNDLQNYTNLRLGIALGDEDEKAYPLWWASPLDMLTEDLAEVKARPKLDMTDTDGDGVIDMIDQEVNSPSGCAVDTRGMVLDSDGDGINDCKDKEPYSPPGYKIDSEGVAQIPEPDMITEDDVNRIVDGKIASIPRPAPVVSAPAAMDWFLPMIHFNDNRYNIKDTEYGKLHQVATVMKQNPGLRVAVTGYTDQTSSNCYNDVLSYNRAQTAIDYLVSKYGISRDRLILNWGGENNNLVPTSGKSLINRRVEFKVATTEVPMGRPNCGVNNAGRGGSTYSGNKEAGY